MEMANSYLEHRWNIMFILIYIMNCIIVLDKVLKGGIMVIPKKASSLLVLILIVVVAGILTACSSPAGTNSPTVYTYGDASPAVNALIDATLQASIAPIPNVAYRSLSGSIDTYTFVGFSSSTSPYTTTPYTLTGSLVQVIGASESGTVNLTGGVVTKMVWTNITSTPSGTYTITFTGGGEYVYDLATHTFTLQ